MIVTLTDARTARYCNKGARQFFATHDLDWYQFVTVGIEAEKLEVFEDPRVQKILKCARERTGGR